MRRRRRHQHQNHERWLISYADFITLLFAFFVVLYSSSKADSRKQEEFGQAIDSAFKALGVFPEKLHPTPRLPHKTATGDADPTDLEGEDVLASPEIQADFRRMQARIQSLLASQIAQHVVSVRMGREGLIITLREAGFYLSGSATPRPDSLATLDRIAKALQSTPYDLRIEGHTDNIPIHTVQFDSNWELSTARATRLARLFIDAQHYAPARLSASGYAEFHPVATNLTEEGRGENRRVDVIVLPRSTPMLQAATTPASPHSATKVGAQSKLGHRGSTAATLATPAAAIGPPALLR